MAWDKNLPADTTALRLGPSFQRNNWEAIETGDATLKLAKLNLAQQGSDPGSIATTYQIYGKNSNGNTELFGQNSKGDIVQLTKGLPTASSNGNTFLPGTDASGALIMAWGRSAGISNNGTITVSAMTEVYQATMTIEDSSASPGSRAYISGISTNVITVKVPTDSSVVLRWIAIGV